MKIIVGLGNPGPGYELNRHNIGFLTLDRIANDYKTSFKKLKFSAQLADFTYQGEKIILAKPQTFMNKSGLAVRDLVNFYKIDPADLIVIYDDIDIDLGTIRVKGKGSAGSHNGMKSIVKELGSKDFPRIRLSIGKNPDYMDLASYVLTNFPEDEMDEIEWEIEKGAEAALEIVENGVNSAMNKYNGKGFND